PHHDVEATVTLVDLPGRPAADGDGDGVVDLGDAEAIPRKLFSSHVDAQHRRAFDLLDLQVTDTADGAEHAGDALRDREDVVELVAEDLDGQVSAHAGEKLIEAHLDGLRE